MVTAYSAGAVLWATAQTIIGQIQTLTCGKIHRLRQTAPARSHHARRCCSRGPHQFRCSGFHRGNGGVQLVLVVHMFCTAIESSALSSQMLPFCAPSIRVSMSAAICCCSVRQSAFGRQKRDAAPPACQMPQSVLQTSRQGTMAGTACPAIRGRRWAAANPASQGFAFQHAEPAEEKAAKVPLPAGHLQCLIRAHAADVHIEQHALIKRPVQDHAQPRQRRAQPLPPPPWPRSERLKATPRLQRTNSPP